MKVSTDAIMFGAWVNLTQRHRILDVGTGTGVLALMCKQRSPSACITAIDIETDAVAEARTNVANSPWPDINVMQQDVNAYHAAEPFDLVISNPPYFDNDLKAGSAKRNLARHTDSLSFAQLVTAWQKLGHEQSQLAVVLPQVEAQKFITEVQDQGGYLVRLCEVKSTEVKPVSRYLMQFSWQQGECDTTQLVIHDKGDYSADYQALCRDFYLRF